MVRLPTHNMLQALLEMSAAPFKKQKKQKKTPSFVTTKTSGNVSSCPAICWCDTRQPVWQPSPPPPALPRFGTHINL